MIITTRTNGISVDPVISIPNNYENPSHPCKFQISADYHMEPTSNDSGNKYYISYSIGGIIEGKESIVNLYQKPSELTIWEIGAIPSRKKAIQGEYVMDLQKLDKKSKGKTLPRHELSLANSGLRRKADGTMKRGKFVDMKRSPPPPNPRAQSAVPNPNLFEYKTRAASNPVLAQKIHNADSRPQSASPGEVRKRSGSSRVKPEPHHYQHPEQHMEPDLVHSVRTRTSSLTALIELLRPRTPPSPHHFDHPLRSVNLNSANNTKRKTSVQPSSAIKSANSKKTGRVLQWGKEAPWERMSKKDNERRDNDYLVELGVEKPEKKRGEQIFIPVAKYSLDLLPFFEGKKLFCIKCEDVYDRINSLEFSIELDCQLLSPAQREYNFQFKFLSHTSRYKTIVEKAQERNLEIGSKHLLLMGLLNQHQLQDDIEMLDFEVEIHDRDFKYSKENVAQKAFFDEGGIVQTDLNPQNPFGIAKFNLKELFNGATSLRLSSPILPSGRSATSQTQQGNWIESNSFLKISIELSYPLPVKVIPDKSLFKHLALFIRAGNNSATVLSIIEKFNMKVLGITEESEKLLKLYSIALTEEQKQDESKLIGGYQFFDENNLILLLEGHGEDINQLVSEFQKLDHVEIIEFEGCETRKRIRPLLLPYPLSIRMKKSFIEILAITRNYLQKEYDSDCFKCLEIFQKLIKVRNGISASRILKFPTVPMVLALAGAYGEIVSPIEGKKFKVPPKEQIKILSNADALLQFEDGEQPKPISTFKSSAKLKATRKVRSKLKCTNSMINTLLIEREFRQPNFISINSQKAHYTSTYTASTSNNVYNYSMQKLSASQKQLQTMQHALAKDGSKYLAYGTEFLSQMIQ